MSLSTSTSWGSASTASVDSISPPCEFVDGVALDWSGRGSSHVDYSKQEALPLTQGRFLGYGMHGGVYETTCNGVALAWKRKYCSRRVGHRERREIEIIKRLQHQHIIRLVGTYTHGPFLGLLLWPVATCDLASLLEDVDWLQKPFQNQDHMQTDHIVAAEETPEQISERQARLQALGLSTTSLEAARIDANAYLERTMGCIASAVCYLHQQEIKHKDLKPSNILLSADGLWVTDFGTATDFSVLTTSATENGERGTPKYFAPEVAVYDPSGRAADVFSMGCIFLEIITLCVGYCLEETVQLRGQNDRSFQANLDTIHRWFSRARISSRTPADEHMMGLVRSMMQKNPEERPTAEYIEEEIALISGLASAAGDFSFFNPCCDLMSGTDAVESWFPSQHLPAPLEMSLIIGNTYMLEAPDLHIYTFFVTVSNPEIIEKVHIFLHQSFRKSHHICTHPPFAFRGRGWGSFDISGYIVLRPGCYWDHPLARPVPRETVKRMLPMSWELNFDAPRTDKIHNVAVRSVRT
ncbi:kinase-like domain-containing protein [Paraphoma chrysanthemicola]|uniref:Kinase-like domain-containing protein n=1 Tax=Paraphoma chrysanthemicola TaxID=798071 RepID=A0A8K0VZR0_9PLEO|nr:kinase-like domain-containing protein [Paraphoma chrysanthemicola]